MSPNMSPDMDLDLESIAHSQSASSDTSSSHATTIVEAVTVNEDIEYVLDYLTFTKEQKQIAFEENLSFAVAEADAVVHAMLHTLESIYRKMELPAVCAAHTLNGLKVVGSDAENAVAWNAQNMAQVDESMGEWEDVKKDWGLVKEMLDSVMGSLFVEEFRVHRKLSEGKIAAFMKLAKSLAAKWEEMELNAKCEDDLMDLDD